MSGREQIGGVRIPFLLLWLPLQPMTLGEERIALEGIHSGSRARQIDRKRPYGRRERKEPLKRVQYK